MRRVPGAYVSPGMCAVPLQIKDGPVIQVCQHWKPCNETFAVVLDVADDWVAFHVQAAQVWQRSEVVHHLHTTTFQDHRAADEVITASLKS